MPRSSSPIDLTANHHTDRLFSPSNLHKYNKMSSYSNSNANTSE
jgi:hypothetical protein